MKRPGHHPYWPDGSGQRCARCDRPRTHYLHGPGPVQGPELPTMAWRVAHFVRRAVRILTLEAPLAWWRNVQEAREFECETRAAFYGCRCGRVCRGSVAARGRNLRAWGICPVVGCAERVWANQPGRRLR